MQRVIVEVAVKTGQTVRAVAAESFALTLWTWAELQRMAREAAVERLGERTDLAGLVAVAFHQPADLQKAEFRYLAAAGKLTTMFDTAKQRMLEMQAKLATARPVAAPDAALIPVPE